MDFLVVLTFILAVLTSVFSGMSGGGGGTVMIPYLIATGISPAAALATGKFGSIGVVTGALTAFKGQGLIDKKYIWPFSIITFVCALISAWLIPQIDSELFKDLIGIGMLLMVPTLFIDKGMFKPGPRSRGFIAAGFVAYAVFSFVQTSFGAGLGTMITLVLMYLFGMGALTSIATKRFTQAIQGVVLFVLLAIQGLVVWTHGVALFFGTTIGTYIGTKYALKKGADFVKLVLAIVMSVSGAALLIS